jgi:hypothetical protein
MQFIMYESKKPQVYRDMIDAMVRACKEGQGQIGARRVREGVWCGKAAKDRYPDQYKIDLLLERLSVAERDVLAEMLAHQVVVGVFETLKILEQFEIEPFKDGYEGTPYHDFTGRLADWKWPKG